MEYVININPIVHALILIKYSKLLPGIKRFHEDDVIIIAQGSVMVESHVTKNKNDVTMHVVYNFHPTSDW